MINHSDCDHPSTSSARAKCRRQRRSGEEPTSTPKNGASVKTIFFGKAHHDPNRERNRGTTPRDRDKQCVVCGVEKIEFRGTDPVTGILLYVGERCTYRVEGSDDFQAVP